MSGDAHWLLVTVSVALFGIAAFNCGRCWGKRKPFLTFGYFVGALMLLGSSVFLVTAAHFESEIEQVHSICAPYDSYQAT